jgi:adenylate cyclase
LIPASVGSVAVDGTPNVTWLSIVHRLDENHVGLSRQFFNKTRSNISGNRRLQLLFIHPQTGSQYHLNLEHEATETDGPRFEWMKTQLEAVASQSGMAAVFRLQGVDVCRVISVEEVPSDQEPVAPAPAPAMAVHERLNSFTEEVNAARDVDDLITRALGALDTFFGYEHAILLLADPSGSSLYTVASHGYPSSGAGAEVKIGEGYIGVAAERRQTVLAANMAKDQAYIAGVREGAKKAGQIDALDREIPLPGLAGVKSQLAVPLLARGQLLGVLCLQSETPGRFLTQDEHIANVVATQLGLSMALLQLSPQVEGSPWRISAPPADIPASVVRHYASDDSILIDDAYLIKGVAGAIFWRVLREYSERHRIDFSNKEMRLDQSLELPDINDNLEARLILLRRRLEDQCSFIHIVKTSRGRFRLNVDRPLSLLELP